MKKNLKEEINISDRYSRHLISGKVTATVGARNPQTLEMVYGLGANRIEVLRMLEKHNKFRLVWYVIFILLGIGCLIIEPRSWFNVIDLIVLLVNIDLVSEGKVVGIYIGIIECLMYAYICLISKLYGEIILMLAISIPLNIFSIVSWTKNLKAQKKSYGDNNGEEGGMTIRKIKAKNWWWILLLLAATFTACYFFLDLLGTSALWFSTGVLATTIFQKILSGLRYKENWWFSIIGHFISIAMWIEVIITSSASGLDLMELAPMLGKIAIIINAFYGYSIWKSMYRKVAVNGGEILAKRKVKIKKIIKLRRIYKEMIWNEEVDTNKNS